MPGASCSLELSERVLTEQENSEDTEDVMTQGSSKDVSNSIVSGLVKMESKPCSKSAIA